MKNRFKHVGGHDVQRDQLIVCVILIRIRTRLPYSKSINGSKLFIFAYGIVNMTTQL